MSETPKVGEKCRLDFEPYTAWWLAVHGRTSQRAYFSPPYTPESEFTVLKVRPALNGFIARVSVDEEVLTDSIPTRFLIPIEAAEGVQDLKAPVTVYEVEAPLSPFAPIVPEMAHALDFEDAIDCIGVDAVVAVKLPFKREFYGNVLSVNAEAQQVLVEAWNSAPVKWYDAENVQLVWTKAAADIAMERETVAIS